MEVENTVFVTSMDGGALTTVADLCAAHSSNPPSGGGSLPNAEYRYTYLVASDPSRLLRTYTR